MSVTVTVVIPTFNRQQLLKRALNSVLSQTQPANEIIVVDDGSNDDTYAMLKTDYPTIKYLKQEHQGVSCARNLGIRAANSEWIALLDSDDAWHPDKLKQQLQALALQPSFRVCHTEEIWYRHGVRVNPKFKHRKHGGYIFQHCLPLCVISPSSVIIHQEVFAKVGLFDEKLPACEDYDLWLRITAYMPVLFIKEALTFKHGGHSDQLSMKIWGLDRFRIRALINIIENGHLNTEDYKAALCVLIKKIKIYLCGARKRCKNFEVGYYEQLLGKYNNC